MMCPACKRAADRGLGREAHCLLGAGDCTCQHRVMKTEGIDAIEEEIIAQII